MTTKQKIYAILRTHGIDQEIDIEDEVAETILIALQQPDIEYVIIDEEGGLVIDYGPEQQC